MDAPPSAFASYYYHNLEYAEAAIPQLSIREVPKFYVMGGGGKLKFSTLPLLKVKILMRLPLSGFDMFKKCSSNIYFRQIIRLFRCVYLFQNAQT